MARRPSDVGEDAMAYHEQETWREYDARVGKEEPLPYRAGVTRVELRAHLGSVSSTGRPVGERFEPAGISRPRLLVSQTPPGRRCRG